MITSLYIVYFTDPFSLNCSPQRSPFFQPQNKLFPKLLPPGRKGVLLTLHFVFVTHHTLKLCSQPQKWLLSNAYKINQPGGSNLSNSCKTTKPCGLVSNQTNPWGQTSSKPGGAHNTHENQRRYLCLPRNLCGGYRIPFLCTRKYNYSLIIIRLLRNWGMALVLCSLRYCCFSMTLVILES